MTKMSKGRRKQKQKLEDQMIEPKKCYIKAEALIPSLMK